MGRMGRHHQSNDREVDSEAALGHLVTSIAHELQQPLGAILRNADAAALILRSQAPNLSELRSIVEDIREDNQRAATIIRNLKARVESPRMERAASPIAHRTKSP